MGGSRWVFATFWGVNQAKPFWMWSTRTSSVVIRVWPGSKAPGLKGASEKKHFRGRVAKNIKKKKKQQHGFTPSQPMPGVEVVKSRGLHLGDSENPEPP